MPRLLLFSSSTLADYGSLPTIGGGGAGIIITLSSLLLLPAVAHYYLIFCCGRTHAILVDSSCNAHQDTESQVETISMLFSCCCCDSLFATNKAQHRIELSLIWFCCHRSSRCHFCQYGLEHCHVVGLLIGFDAAEISIQ